MYCILHSVYLLPGKTQKAETERYSETGGELSKVNTKRRCEAINDKNRLCDLTWWDNFLIYVTLLITHCIPSFYYDFVPYYYGSPRMSGKKTKQSCANLWARILNHANTLVNYAHGLVICSLGLVNCAHNLANNSQ